MRASLLLFTDLIWHWKTDLHVSLSHLFAFTQKLETKFGKKEFSNKGHEGFPNIYLFSMPWHGLLS